MSEPRPGASLVPLSESDQTIADPDADVRGRDVIDSENEKVGTVEDILVDDEELRARFLRVGSGGFLGIGKEHFLVPVDAIVAVEPERVRIDRDRARLGDVPVYDPDVVEDLNYYESVYGWWGVAPYWGPGYVYPGYPLH